MVITVSAEKIQLLPGSEVTLRYQIWADYEAILESRRDDAAIKIHFSANTQEISILASMAGHGRRIDILADLVKALLRCQDRDWDSSHPLTLKRLQEAGAEPDACFYIQNWQVMLGKERLDLTIDPPPDLAVEVDLTSLTSLDIYQTLAVPELWIDRQGALKIYVLTPDGYRDSADSPTFLGIDVKGILPRYVERAWSAGSIRALREFEQFLKAL